MFIEENLKLVKNYSMLQYFALRLLYLHGLRVSEVLDISIYDRIKEDVWLIRVKKGGDNSTITISNWEEIMKLSSGINGRLFGSLRRETLHRTCNKFGLYIKKKHNENRATTHMFRNANAKLLMEKFGSAVVVKDVLNHKSIKSQETYLKK